MNISYEFINIRDSCVQQIYILLFEYSVKNISLNIENSYVKYIGILVYSTRRLYYYK